MNVVQHEQVGGGALVLRPLRWPVRVFFGGPSKTELSLSQK